MEIIETSKTKLAREKLAKHTSKPIRIRSLEEVAIEMGHPGAKNYLGGAFEKEDEIEIALNHRRPETHENTFIHEVSHIILKNEGYPRVLLKENTEIRQIPQLWNYCLRLQSSFSSIIEHPEIYSRMKNEYDLDLDFYFNTLSNQKVDRFKSLFKSGELKEVFLQQQNILDGLEYFYYVEPYCTSILDLFENTDKPGYQSCHSLHNKITKTGKNSPEQCREAGKLIQSHIINYGEKRKLHPLLSNVWKSISIN